MKRVRITAIRQTVYDDLSALYENPLETPCCMRVGQVLVSENAQRPEGLCETAWECMRPFVETLAKGGGNFFDGWMKDPYSAVVSCNDGIRPMSYFLKVEE